MGRAGVGHHRRVRRTGAPKEPMSRIVDKRHLLRSVKLYDAPTHARSLVQNQGSDRTGAWRNLDPTPRANADHAPSVSRCITWTSTSTAPVKADCHATTIWCSRSPVRISSRNPSISIATGGKGSCYRWPILRSRPTKTTHKPWPSEPNWPLNSEKPPRCLAACGGLLRKRSTVSIPLSDGASDIRCTPRVLSGGVT